MRRIMNNLSIPERKAHLYALMAWSNQYSKEQAEEIAYTSNIEELRRLTNATNSIEAAINGIIDNFKEPLIKTNPSENDWDIVIKILDKIHNN